MTSTSSSWIYGATDRQIEFPIVYTNARTGTASLDPDAPGQDLQPLMDLLVAHTPPPRHVPGHPLQLLVTNLAANDYVGRMAVGRIRNGRLRMGQRITVLREEAETCAGRQRGARPRRHAHWLRDVAHDGARHRAGGDRGSRPRGHRGRGRAAGGSPSGIPSRTLPTRARCPGSPWTSRP